MAGNPLHAADCYCPECQGLPVVPGKSQAPPMIDTNNPIRALDRANRIINWMAPHIGRMAPPDNGIAELNDHWLYMEKIGRAGKLRTDRGAPLDQKPPGWSVLNGES